jgi:cob(I)alamin adenosyltransferase
LDEILATLQNDLFNVGADLATPEESRWEGMYRVGKADITKLESWIDTLNEELPPLREFILPGGGPVGGFLHQARTICRRAERIVVSLRHSEESIGDGCLIYLNRLSDLLFVAARWAAQSREESEYFWQKPSGR